jgi:hypothetical protein
VAKPTPPSRASDRHAAGDAAGLDFGYRVAKSGDVAIHRNGRVVTRLRGAAAAAFAAEAAHLAPAALQQRLARLTGRYRRGNERTASAHPRNRGTD